MRRLPKNYDKKSNANIVSILSLIIALASILANIATTYINNRTQEILKDAELSYSYRVNGYLDFSESLNTIVSTNKMDDFLSAEMKLASSQLRLSIYLNDDLGNELERFIDKYFEVEHFKLIPMVEDQTFDDKEKVKRILIMKDLVGIQNIMRKYLFTH